MGGGYQAPTTQPYTPQYTQNYRFSAPAPSNMVNRAYGDLFGRSPDASGTESWGTHLANGMAPSDVLRHMSNSPEFQAQQDYSRGYTSVFRPGYKEFGPNGQYYQPIYQSQYMDYRSPQVGSGYGGMLGGLGSYGMMGGYGGQTPYGQGGIFGGYGGYGGGGYGDGIVTGKQIGRAHV